MGDMISLKIMAYLKMGNLTSICGKLKGPMSERWACCFCRGLKICCYCSFFSKDASKSRNILSALRSQLWHTTRTMACCPASRWTFSSIAVVAFISCWMCNLAGWTTFLVTSSPLASWFSAPLVWIAGVGAASNGFRSPWRLKYPSPSGSKSTDHVLNCRANRSSVCAWKDSNPDPKFVQFATRNEFIPAHFPCSKGLLHLMPEICLVRWCTLDLRMDEATGCWGAGGEGAKKKWCNWRWTLNDMMHVGYVGTIGWCWPWGNLTLVRPILIAEAKEMVNVISSSNETWWKALLWEYLAEGLAGPVAKIRSSLPKSMAWSKGTSARKPGFHFETLEASANFPFKQFGDQGLLEYHWLAVSLLCLCGSDHLHSHGARSGSEAVGCRTQSQQVLRLVNGYHQQPVRQTHVERFGAIMSVAD